MSICSQGRISQFDIKSNKKGLKFYVVSLNGERIALDFVPSYTVAEVLSLIQDSHDIENQALKFKGNTLQLHRSIAECGVRANDRLQLRTRGLKMRVIVTTPGEGAVALDVESTDTIISVKEKIQERLRIMSELQVLSTGLEYDLKDTETLANYNVQNKSMLLLTTKMAGGMRSVFALNFNNLTEEFNSEFNSSAPDWRTVYHGLNFLSTCLNPNCSAYNQSIYVKKGFGSFDVAETSFSLQCPMCGRKAKESSNFGFYMAKWEFKGMLDSGEKITKSGISDTYNYHTFKEGGNASWRYLQLTVSTLTVSKLPELESCLLW